MIDLHCHIDLYPDPRKVAAECRERDLFVLSVTTTPSAFHGTAALAEAASSIETALGLHPQLARERQREVALFDQILPSVRWVGEIGLDGTSECRPFWDTQVAVFEHILQSCVNQGGRGLSIHSRAAAGAVVQTLRRLPDAGVPVMHWFSGTNRELEAAVEIGCWFSIGLPMLRSKKGRSLVAAMPRSRLLTETDGPFVEEAGKPAMPWDVKQVEMELAALWGVPTAEVESTLSENLTYLRQLVRAH